MMPKESQRQKLIKFWRGNQNGNLRNYPEDFGHENGMYQTLCRGCGNFFLGHKRRFACKVCANKDMGEEYL